MSARVAMLRMHKDGHILLPPPRSKRPDPTVHITASSDPGQAIDLPAHQRLPLSDERVKNKSQSRQWNEYIHRYHYLGQTPLPGAPIRYMVYRKHQPIALLGFAACAWQTAPRDHSIGWSPEQRKRNLQLIVNNARFLILPWVSSPNLASMILARAAKLLPHDWQQQDGYQPVLLETFVEKPRFKGTCYKAANWVFLGQTKGRGKLGPAGKQSVPIKDVLVYPLCKNFRVLLKR